MEQMAFRSLYYFISRCSAVLLLPDATPERFRSRDINLRIALHAGPGYWCFDPILERMTYVGTHVAALRAWIPLRHREKFTSAKPCHLGSGRRRYRSYLSVRETNSAGQGPGDFHT